VLVDRNDVDLIEKTSGYNGFFTLNVFRLQHKTFTGGKTPILQRECMERGHAVGVLAYDPKQDKVVLLEQFRIGAMVNNDAPWLFEIIAGIVEEGESQQEVARREAMEEANCHFDVLEPICNFYSSPGGSSETTQLYCACIDSTNIGGIHGVEEEGEDIRVFTISFDEAVNWLSEGRLNNASTIISLQWLMLNRSRLRAQY
jgi:ADP-ribose pyrophosphatase